jgi:CHAT domain-containing protein
MRLNAQLAVLSACNTGYGKIAKGEGVMSLARGFAQAGVPAIVMSLWTAQDKSTSEIMGNFYKALADGKTKDESLKIAKLTYLENASKLGAHPYFWAAFVLVGENKPLEFHTTHYIFYGFIALFIISFLVYFSVIRKNISTNQKIR